MKVALNKEQKEDSDYYAYTYTYFDDLYVTTRISVNYISVNFRIMPCVLDKLKLFIWADPSCIN